MHQQRKRANCSRETNIQQAEGPTADAPWVSAEREGHLFLGHAVRIAYLGFPTFTTSFFAAADLSGERSELTREGAEARCASPNRPASIVHSVRGPAGGKKNHSHGVIPFLPP